MCPVLRELSRTQFGDFVFYYVSREHTNVLHARSSLGVAAPGAAGVRIPPPSEEGGGGGREREGGGEGRGSTSAKRDSRDADGELHARLRAALAPAVATHTIFFFFMTTPRATPVCLGSR